MMIRSLPDPVKGLPVGVGADDDAGSRARTAFAVRAPSCRPARGRDDQDPSHKATREHLANVEPGHDGLARPRLVGQEKAEARLRQHVVVDGDPLVGQRIDQRDFGRKGGIEEMAEGQSLPSATTRTISGSVRKSRGGRREIVSLPPKPMRFGSLDMVNRSSQVSLAVASMRVSNSDRPV